MSTTEVQPDPKVKTEANKSSAGNKSKSASRKRSSASKNKTATAVKPATTPKREKPVKPGMPTTHPANFLKSQRQPPKGQKVTDAMVKKAREEWGIEPYVKSDGYVVLRPGSRGHIVHAATSKSAEHTLCFTPTNWVGGATVVEDKGELNCLWCKTRII